MAKKKKNIEDLAKQVAHDIKLDLWKKCMDIGQEIYKEALTEFVKNIEEEVK